jgi:phosphoglycolate phosphatase
MCGSTAVGAVLFDLDGTLVDSYPGIASAYRQVLDQLDLGEMDDASIRSLIGPSIQVVLEDHFGLAGTRLRDGIRVFRDHYGAEGLLRFRKYDGIDAMLVQLQKAGLDLYIATSKLSSMAVDIVTHAGWGGVFTFVGGADAGGVRYRKKDIIEWTLEQMANGPPPVAMIGDRGVDILGGRDLGLAGIGVAWGYGSAQELTDAGAVLVAEIPEQLLPALESLS